MVVVEDEGIGDCVLDRDIANCFVRCYVLKISSKGILVDEFVKRVERQGTRLKRRTGSAHGNITSLNNKL